MSNDNFDSSCTNCSKTGLVKSYTATVDDVKKILVEVCENHSTSALAEKTIASLQASTELPIEVL